MPGTRRAGVGLARRSEQREKTFWRSEPCSGRMVLNVRLRDEDRMPRRTGPLSGKGRAGERSRQLNPFPTLALSPREQALPG